MGERNRPAHNVGTHQRAGFAMPLTLSTTCPESAVAFLDKVGEAVIKPAIGVGSTRLVTADDRVTRFLDLHYAASDAIEGADGRLRLLDCNPDPFVIWLPEAHRRTVFGSLARYLVEGTRVS